MLGKPVGNRGPARRGHRIRRAAIAAGSSLVSEPEKFGEMLRELGRDAKHGGIPLRRLYDVFGARESATAGVSQKAASKRLRAAVRRASKLLATNPKVVSAAATRLGQAVKAGQISMRDVYRVLQAPLSVTTLVSKLREFSGGRMHLAELQEIVDKAYERSVPNKVCDHLMASPKGDFWRRLLFAALEYKTPNSFVMSMALKRMRRLRLPPEEIKAAETLNWQIHNTVHDIYVAAERGDAAKVRELRATVVGLRRKFAETYKDIL